MPTSRLHAASKRGATRRTERREWSLSRAVLTRQIGTYLVTHAAESGARAPHEEAQRGFSRHLLVAHASRSRWRVDPEVVKRRRSGRSRRRSAEAAPAARGSSNR